MAGAINGAEEPYGEAWLKHMSERPMGELIAQIKTTELKLAETRDLLLQTTRNLGHPAYNHSFGTTQAIDELREKAFDFLGVPKEGGDKKE